LRETPQYQANLVAKKFLRLKLQACLLKERGNKHGQEEKTPPRPQHAYEQKARSRSCCCVEGAGKEKA
jgi:hypothetical protein